MKKKICILFFTALLLVAFIGLFISCSSNVYETTETTTEEETTSNNDYYDSDDDYNYDYDDDDDYDYDDDDYEYGNNYGSSYNTTKSYNNYNYNNTSRYKKKSYNYYNSYNYNTTRYKADDTPTYKQDDPYYRANDYNNDGKLSQDEFQGAVDDWMSAHGY